MDVKFEGKNVHLLSDPMTNNGGGSGSPANSATMVGLLQEPATIEGAPGETVKCPDCGSNVTVQPPPQKIERTLTPGQQGGQYSLGKTEIGSSVWTPGSGPQGPAGPLPREIRRTSGLNEGLEVVQTHSCNLTPPRDSNHFEIRAKRKLGESQAKWRKRTGKLLKIM